MIRCNICMIALAVILPLTISSRVQAGIAEERQILVVLRFDDYSSRSHTDIETKLIDAFQKYNISCTFGVIPYVCARNTCDPRTQDVIPLTPAKGEILINAIKAGILEVALHGYSHQTVCETNGYTEFHGVNYDVQFEKIAKGKSFLEELLGIQVTIFIPPWNSYDLNTIRALEKLQFRCISADVNGDAEETSSLKFLPRTCGLPELRYAVESARNVPEIQPIIVVLFHEYDFLEIDKEHGKLTYREFIELLDWLTAQDDIHIHSIDQTIEMAAGLGAHRLLLHHRLYYKPPSFVPPFLFRLYFPTGVYLSEASIDNLRPRSMKTKLLMLTSVFYLAMLLLSSGMFFLAGFILFPKLGPVIPFVKYGAPTLLVLLSIYALRNLELGYRGAMAIAVGLGYCIGLWSCPAKPGKQDHLEQE